MSSPSNTTIECLRLALAAQYATGTIKAALVGPGWTPNKATTEYRSSWQAHEVTGTNWPAGGVTATITVTADKPSGVVTIKGNPFTVANVTVANYRHLVFWKSVGSAATDPILLYSSLTSTQSKNNESLMFEEVKLLVNVGPDR